jgi:hypothetical protein
MSWCTFNRHARPASRLLAVSGYALALLVAKYLAGLFEKRDRLLLRLSLRYRKLLQSRLGNKGFEFL